MATVLSIGTAALKELGVLAAGEPLSADEGTDVLAALNRLLDQMAAERLQIYAITRTLFTITPSLGTYAVGSGVAVNRARPMFVDRVGWVDTATNPDSEYPLHRLTQDEWMALPQRDATSTIPTSFYYDPTFPTGTLALYPVPTNSNMQGVMYAPTAVSAFASLATTVALPPGYEEMLITNLAINMASSYSKQPDPLLVQRARESKAIVKRSNTTPKMLYFDPGAMIGGGGRYDVNTDTNL